MIADHRDLVSEVFMDILLMALVELLGVLFAADKRRAAHWRVWLSALLFVVLLVGLTIFFQIRRL